MGKGGREERRQPLGTEEKRGEEGERQMDRETEDRVKRGGGRWAGPF